jgi:inositol phosphorylceramide synthase catalytic subunit
MESDLQPAPPAARSRNWLAAAAVAVYVLLMLIWKGLGWQHLGLAVLIWACLTTAPGPRRFVRAWWPMILFWLCYDVMRVFASTLYSRVAVEAPLRWEAAIFRTAEGSIWPFHFARWLTRAGDAFWPRLLGHFCSVIYLSHVFLIPIVFLMVWLRQAERLFQRLLWSYAALHVLTFAIWFSYPAAPPWWIYQNGYIQPSLAHSMPIGLGAGSTLFALFQFNPNRFAAIPSLHAAYPLLLTLVLALHGVRNRWIVLAGVYTACMWFACVFLNQHYIIDLLIGAATVWLALLISWRKIR